MEGYTDKEILNDGLLAEKASTGKYNMAATECVHEQVRDTMLNILDQEHSIQHEVFEMMHKRGFYETPAAEEQKVQQAKMKHAQCVK